MLYLVPLLVVQGLLLSMSVAILRATSAARPSHYFMLDKCCKIILTQLMTAMYVLSTTNPESKVGTVEQN